ncbi:MAG: hypothetical protein LBD59_00835 [Prevotellaceae bacterium]|jgi:hypothetical protein|nr:hypothetical protein [Prevotellaceae bacterium]
MNKSLLLMTVASTGMAQKLPVTIGGGGLFHADFSNFRAGIPYARIVEFSQKDFAAGGHLSVEAFMCELGVNFRRGTLHIDRTDYVAAGWSEEFTMPTLLRTAFKNKVSVLDLNLFVGKYPFKISESVNFFPQIGLCYQMFLSMKNGNETGIKYSDFNALLYKHGGGFDFFITNSILFRTEALFVLRLNNNYEKQIKRLLGSHRFSLGYGAEIKIGIRYILNYNRI